MIFCIAVTYCATFLINHFYYLVRPQNFDEAVVLTKVATNERGQNFNHLSLFLYFLNYLAVGMLAILQVLFKYFSIANCFNKLK